MILLDCLINGLCCISQEIWPWFGWALFCCGYISVPLGSCDIHTQILRVPLLTLCHYDVLTWKLSPHYWSLWGNHWSPVDSPHKGSVMWSVGVSFINLNKLLYKQLSCWWFEVPWCSWAVTVMAIKWLPQCHWGNLTEIIHQSWRIWVKAASFQPQQNRTNHVCCVLLWLETDR